MNSDTKDDVISENYRIVSYQKLAEKLHEFTYGLLYPAFFGNMIYDLVLLFKANKKSEVAFTGGMVILLFYALDYVHLYVDVNKEVGKGASNKSWWYIICDIITSLLFFFSFVELKSGCLCWASMFIGVIPILTASYKSQLYGIRNKRMRVIGLYGISSLVALFTFQWLLHKTPKELHPNYFLGLVFFEFIFYFIYVSFVYKPIKDLLLETIHE